MLTYHYIEIHQNKPYLQLGHKAKSKQKIEERILILSIHFTYSYQISLSSPFLPPVIKSHSFFKSYGI